MPYSSADKCSSSGDDKKYSSDLCFILAFQQCKSGILTQQQYLGSFEAFLSDFRVLRWIGSNKVPYVLADAMTWVHGQTPHDPDQFSKYLKSSQSQLSKNHLSLASKILFLNDPVQVTPIDRCVTAALGLPSNTSYSTFKPCFDIFKQQCKAQIQQGINAIQPYLQSAEASLQVATQHAFNIAAIRENRMADKLLWVMGKAIGKC